MSIKKRFADLTTALEAGATTAAQSSISESGPKATSSAPPAKSGPHTAPGGLFMVRDQMERDAERIAELEAAVARFDGAQPARQLDPRQIRSSRFANRHEAHFASSEFAALKDELRRTQGNVQPIVVRPLAASAGDAQYEVVFGHRRYRACLELGLPVQAVVTQLDDRALFLAMTAENLAREDLTPYELGQHYRRALDAGFFQSQRELADYFDRSRVHVAQALQVADLPDFVVAAFASPLDIQYRWAASLSAALHRDRQAVQRRATQVQAERARGAKLSGKQVWERLAGEAKEAPAAPLRLGGKVVGNLRLDKTAVAGVEFANGVVPAERAVELQAVLERFLDSLR